MTYFYLYLAEVLILFLLNRIFNVNLVKYLGSKVKAKRAVLYCVYIFYLPSIFFHEFAHYLAAKLMLLRVTKVKLVPSIEGNKFELGSVQFESGGGIRNFMASSAPFWLGNIALFIIIRQMLALPLGVPFLLFGVIAFELANALVLSWADIKSALIVYTLVAILILALSAGLISINFESEAIANYFLNMDKYLIVPMTVNGVFVIIMLLARRYG